MIKGKLKDFKYRGAKLSQFYSDCVSLSRACKLHELAKVWPAHQQWRYDNSDGKEGYS